MDTQPFQIVLTNCPDSDSANTIAYGLVNEGLAACVNILPAGYSVYHWQGKVETAREHILLVKSHIQHYQVIEERIRALHPYELPAIVAVPIVNGLTEYLAWIADPRKTT
ncbi:MAG: divalent-cation tolerance protein CutA [Acidiferrobacterales bacterium]